MCSLLYSLPFQLSHLPVSMERFKLRKQKNGGFSIGGTPRCSMNGPGGPFMEPCVMLQIASTEQSFPSVIEMLIFLRLCLGLLL